MQLDVCVVTKTRPESSAHTRYVTKKEAHAIIFGIHTYKYMHTWQLDVFVGAPGMSREGRTYLIFSEGRSNSSASAETINFFTSVSIILAVSRATVAMGSPLEDHGLGPGTESALWFMLVRHIQFISVLGSMGGSRGMPDGIENMAVGLEWINMHIFKLQISCDKVIRVLFGHRVTFEVFCVIIFCWIGACSM